MKLASAGLALLIILVVVGPVLAGPDRPVPSRTIDVDEIPRLRVPPPDGSSRPRAFRDSRNLAGWIARLPAEQARSQTRMFPSPAVADGRVYVGGGYDSHSLHSFAAGTGKLLWSLKLDDNGPSTVAVTRNLLVVNTESCTTYGIDPRRGARTWSTWIGPNVMAAPTITAGRVYTAHRTKTDESLLTALNPKDGSVLWSRPITSDLIGPPVRHGDRLYLAGRNGMVTCFDLDGSLQWVTGARAGSAPWVDRAGVFVAESTAWRVGAPSVRRLDPRNGRILWRTELGQRYEPPKGTRTPGPDMQERSRLISGWQADAPRPVVLGDRCIIAGGRELVVLDADTGEAVRALRLSAGDGFHAPPAVLGERLLYVTLDGTLLEVEPKSATVRHALRLGVPINSQPVVVAGRVFLVSRDLLYAVPWDRRTTSEWSQWGGDAGRGGGQSTR